jgi:hypothetical protein
MYCTSKMKLLVVLIILSVSFSCSQKVKTDQGTPEYDVRWTNHIYSAMQEAPVGGGFQMEGYWVWCGSVIKGDDGMFHMFASRWPKKLPFHPGWMVASEVVHALADKPEGPYQFNDVALPARGAEFWDGRSTHNPRITKYKDTYYIFYMGSTHPFDEITKPDTLTLKSSYCTVARSNKRIGLAWSKNINGPWTRMEKPILDTKPETFYSFLTSNPSPWINEDGSVVLMFKSRKYKQGFPFQSSMMIGIATAPKVEGPYSVAGNEPIFGENKIGEIEDPFLWRDESGYHVIAKDQQGKITGEFQSGILAHSKDAIHWQLDKSPLAYSRKLKWNDGTTQTMGQLERPFILFQEGKPTHLFFATMDGAGGGGFNNSTRSWNMVIPLKNNK